MKPTTTVAIGLATLLDAFHCLDTRVEAVWIHPAHMPELRTDPEYDPIAQMSVIQQVSQAGGGRFEGLLWGVRILSSELVPMGRACVLLAGFEARLVSGEGSVPFMIQ